MEWNWAFVIIAGVVILGFFITFAVRYINIQNMKDNAIIAGDIYNTLYALQKSPYKTEMNASLFLNVELDFGCDKLSVGNFISKSLEREFIFSPKKMQTDTLSIWMQSWKYPFRVANLFYISSREKRYIIVFDAQSSSFVNSLDFPKNFNIEKTTSIPNINDKNTRIISFTSESADVTITPKEDGSAMIDNQEYPVFGLPLVYAAMFSENYPCILDRLLKKYSDIVEIYREKADYMFALNQGCDYSQIKRTLSSLNNAINSKNYNEIRNYARILEEQNSALVSVNCQPLY